MKEKEWVELQIGRGILSGLDDDCYGFFYRTMHDYGMDFYDADKYAWLNTLFGYDIGADHALGIINWLCENGTDAFEMETGSKETLENICKFELGYHLDFNSWVNENPKTTRYDWR